MFFWQFIYDEYTELSNGCSKAGKGIVLFSPPDSAAEEMETHFAECSEQGENDAERKHEGRATPEQ